MKKSVIRWLMILAAVLIGYHVVIFAIPLTKTSVFWLSYGFTLIATAVQVYVVHSAFYHSAGIKSKFYGFPIARIGTWYFIAQLILGFVFMATGTMVKTWIPTVLYAILFCAAVIGLVVADASRDEVEYQDRKAEKQTSTMRELRAKVDFIASQAKDSKVSQTLEKLAEEFRFSDPVSNPLLAEAEDELAACVEGLQEAVLSENPESILSQIDCAKQILAKRNRICKARKG